jgi:hypothetical protein
MTFRSRLRLVVTTGFVSSCMILSVTASWASATNGSNSFMVLGCDGRYVQISAGSGKSLASGLYAGLNNPESRIDGCLVTDLVDAGGNVLYALMPESAHVDENGAQQFFVATVDAKSLKILKKYELPNKQSDLPLLFSDASRKNLLVTIDDYSSWKRVEIGSDGTLVLSTSLITPKVPFPTSPSPYIDGLGNIVDGLQILNQQGDLIREISGYSILDSSLQQKFGSQTQVKGSNQHYYGTIPAAFGADRIVFTVGWDTENNRVPSAGIFVYDLLSGLVISSFSSAFPVAPGYTGELGVPSVHFSPDGKKIIIEEYDWRPNSADQSRELRLRTGKIAIYDADRGILIGTLTLESSTKQPADGRVVNFSNDSRELYYWFDKHLFAIDLQNNSVSLGISLPADFDPVVVVSGR